MASDKPAIGRPGLWTLLREDVDCVFHRDPAARSRFEVVTTYPGVHAILLQRIEVLERTLQARGEPVDGQCQGPIPTGFMPLGDPIWDAAQGAVRRHWSFQGDEPQRRDAPISGRPFGLAAVTASAALQSLPMEQPLAALRALHPSVTATNEEHESCRDRPSCEADDLCGTQVAHTLRKI